MKTSVGIVMGSQSDLQTMQEAARALSEFGVSFEMKVVSAHRTPHELHKYGCDAVKRGFKVLIAGAGGAAHLPGMLASLTELPVIGVPVMTKKFNGLDSLLSIVQMPKGIPVATMAVDNAWNAGVFAAQILASHDPKLLKKITAYKQKMRSEVVKIKLPKGPKKL